jgi:hypothetical protein
VIEPLRISFVVGCPADHAFSTWTARASSWWPIQHTVSSEAGLEAVFEPRLGGRVFERTSGGQEIPWGEITAWDPPRRLRYNGRIAADPADATHVEIVFNELGDSTTRVEIEHSGWERLGAMGPAWREVNRGGWDGVLPAYVAACSRLAGLESDLHK